MPMVEDLGGLLTDAGLVEGDTGWTLGYERLVQSPARFVCLYEPAGNGADATDSKLEYRSLQVFVRGDVDDVTSVTAKANAIYRTLHRKSGQIGSRWYVSIIAQQLPGILRLDELERRIVWNNYAVVTSS